MKTKNAEITKERPTLISGVKVPDRMQLPERHARAAQEINQLADKVTQLKKKLMGR